MHKLFAVKRDGEFAGFVEISLPEDATVLMLGCVHPAIFKNKQMAKLAVEKTERYAKKHGYDWGNFVIVDLFEDKYHHEDDEGRMARTPQESMEFINSNHPCCLPIGDVCQITRALESSESKLVAVRETLATDASGRPVHLLLWEAAQALDAQGGGPLVDCLKMKSCEIEALALVEGEKQ